MSTQFQWQAGDDDGRWETIAQATGRIRRRRAPQWIWIALLAAIVSAATCAYLVVRQRYDRSSRQVAFQIQSVIDLEARAFAQGDEDLFLAQQDETTFLWLATLAQRSSARRGRFLTPLIAVLPARAEDVNLQGDVAWVQVVEGDPPMRRVRFYRRTDQGWLHTAPVLKFWRDPVEHYYGDRLILRYHQRDQPYIDPLVGQLGQAFSQVCASVGCREDEQFEILFYPAPADSDIQANLTLPSPWLSGIPVDRDWGESYLEAVLSALETRVTAWANTEDAVGPFPRGRAIASERWLGLSPVTPEMVNLSVPLIRRGGAFRGQFDAPEGERYTFP